MNYDDWISDWQRCLARVRRELTLLTADEQLWMEQRIAEVMRIKGELHRLFVAAEGPQSCRTCDGACCAKGQHHMTLVEVLSAMTQKWPLPEPLVDATCPFLGERGCLLDPEIRPFNCITFNCELVEDRLDSEQQQTFYRLEKELREHYAEFEGRYTGASLRGLVIRAERLGEGRLLARPTG